MSRTTFVIVDSVSHLLLADRKTPRNTPCKMSWQLTSDALYDYYDLRGAWYGRYLF